MSALREAVDARAATVRARVGAKIAAALPGVSIREEEDAIVVSGRGLVARWLARDELRDWREDAP